MKKDKAINILRSIQNDYVNSLDCGEYENPDEDSKYAVDSNKECIEALNMAIKALSR